MNLTTVLASHHSGIAYDQTRLSLQGGVQICTAVSAIGPARIQVMAVNDYGSPNLFLTKPDRLYVTSIPPVRYNANR